MEPMTLIVLALLVLGVVIFIYLYRTQEEADAFWTLVGTVSCLVVLVMSGIWLIPIFALKEFSVTGSIGFLGRMILYYILVLPFCAVIGAAINRWAPKRIRWAH